MPESISFAYQLSGPVDAPVVLFLHGFLGRGDDWSEITAGLGDHFRCLTVDLPGHGNTIVSGPDSLYSAEPTGLGLIDLLDSLGIGACHLIGYSMGGRLALYLALQYPKRFNRIVLESASPGLKTEPERAARRAHDEALAQKITTTPHEDFLRYWYAQPLWATLHRRPERLEQLIAGKASADPAGLARSLRQFGTGSMPSQWEQLESAGESLGRRLCLITGEEDSKFSQIATAVAVLAPGARSVPVAGCGHNVHFENPKEFVRLVGAFLTE